MMYPSLEFLFKICALVERLFVEQGLIYDSIDRAGGYEPVVVQVLVRGVETVYTALSLLHNAIRVVQ